MSKRSKRTVSMVLKQGVNFNDMFMSFFEKVFYGVRVFVSSGMILSEGFCDCLRYGMDKEFLIDVADVECSFLPSGCNDTQIFGVTTPRRPALGKD